MANNRRNTTITVLISLFLLTGTVLYAQTPIWPDSPADKRIQFIQSININEFENPPSKSLFHKLKNFFFAELLPPLIKPMGLDIDGNILAVADAATAGIHLYDLKNNSRLFLTYRIKNSLQSPIDAVIIDKEIYVIYSTCRNIAIFNLEGEIVKTLPLHSEKSRYTGISEYNNRLFLVNTAEHHILSLNLEGEDPIILGRRGKGADEMNYPTFLTHDSKGNIYISDSMNFRLLRWNILDNIKKIIGKRGMMSGQLNRPKGIAVY
ncbi:MAG: hypothetical protein KAI81_08100, partial [Candidatus Marinimicrobia bacterium]|nr:hypothetical protein [Candidatus Neomarinimicrobiota bacterium]